MNITHNIEQIAAKIADSKIREQILKKLNVIRLIDRSYESIDSLEELLDLVSCAPSWPSLEASSFIQNYAQLLGCSTVELAGEILRRLANAEETFSREMLYRCLLDVYKKHPGRIWVTDPGILLLMLTELPKDIATANESAASHVDPEMPPNFPGVLCQRDEFITLTIALECWNAIEVYPWDRPLFPMPSAAVLEGIHKVLCIRRGHGANPEEREAIEGIRRLLVRISSKSP